MPQFRFVARNTEGKLIDGLLDCNDRSAAIRQVEQQRCVPIKIEAVTSASTSNGSATKTSEPSASPAKNSGAARVDVMSHGQQYLFTEQLANLLGAGITLDEALGILVRRLKHPRLHGISLGLHQALVDGRSLSQALKDYPKIFSPLYVNLVAAGEVSGQLGDILKRLVKHLADVKGLTERVQQALLYPALLVVAGIGLVIVFMTQMVPKLVGFFKETGRELPASTRALLEIDHLLMTYWWLGLAHGIGLMSLFKVFTRNPDGRYAWDTFLWNLPGYSRIIRYRFYAQFSRTMGTLVENGVELLRALELIEEISGNEFVRRKMVNVRKAVLDGAPLSKAIAEQKIFPGAPLGHGLRGRANRAVSGNRWAILRISTSGSWTNRCRSFPRSSRRSS